MNRRRPITRKRHYVSEMFFFIYMVLWFGAWYFVMRTGSKIGVVVQVILFIVFFLTQPTGIPFESYEKAMRRRRELEGEICKADVEEASFIKENGNDAASSP